METCNRETSKVNPLSISTAIFHLTTNVNKKGTGNYDKQ